MSETGKDAYLSGYRMGMEAVRASKSALNHRIDELYAEVERLRKYTRTLAVANLDMAARLQDYIGQYDPTDAFVSEVKAENAKLRELVKGLMGHVMHPPCEGCIAEMNCDCSDLTQCDEWLFFEADARRLGIEVDE